MANMPHVTKKVLSIQVTRELYYQLQQEARDHKLDFSVYIRMILSEAMIDVELNDSNKRIIQKEIEDAKSKRNKG